MQQRNRKSVDKSYVALAVCPVCGQDSGVVIDRRLRETFGVGDRFPLTCAVCEKHIKAGGAWLIEVRDGEKGENPFRTGYLVGLSAEWRQRTGSQPVSYIEQSALKEIMGDQYGVQQEPVDTQQGK